MQLKTIAVALFTLLVAAAAVSAPSITQEGCAALYVTGNELWSISAAGQARLLARDERGINTPRWSPSGRRIAYVHDFQFGGDRVSDLVVIDSTSGDIVTTIPIAEERGFNDVLQLGWRGERAFGRRDTPLRLRGSTTNGTSPAARRRMSCGAPGSRPRRTASLWRISHMLRTVHRRIVRRRRSWSTIAWCIRRRATSACTRLPAASPGRDVTSCSSIGWTASSRSFPSMPRGEPSQRRSHSKTPVPSSA